MKVCYIKNIEENNYFSCWTWIFINHKKIYIVRQWLYFLYGFLAKFVSPIFRECYCCFFHFVLVILCYSYWNYMISVILIYQKLGRFWPRKLKENISIKNISKKRQIRIYKTTIRSSGELPKKKQLSKEEKYV